MTLTHDIEMRPQLPAIIAEPGCELSASNIAIRGVVGIRVTGGHLRLVDVKIETAHPGIEIDGANARVEVKGLYMGNCSNRCMMVRSGTLELEDTHLAAGMFAVDGAGHISIRSSSLRGEQAALSLYGDGEATVENSTLTGERAAVSVRLGGKVRFAGGKLFGAVDVGEGEVLGLESMEVAPSQ